ncbi:helix-hairpin-helix domain-containing protein [Hydrogenimonas thermophila]|uniref:ComEA family DNA-binding protein n=1 Tax=Hydrogenimonas thermophila TaxID=223786 RepID=UPI0029371130|nr:helix-hairpin-helix domain-containing protein [Hydrogenimonas thermophila]WOE69816.1 helix-hairpin-helix domain-containing protein [Hydrogenimonas thermophila]WOE72331.1 helix-hairpin-helix domain-containing protein [Hydrogenimonas thermophila]
MSTLISKVLVGSAMAVVSLFASVDINSASADELMTLNGIGKGKAEAIVAYRKNHCFKNINDLSSVKGIGSKIVEKNRKNITAGECKK